jgi:hypothetical protein
MFLLSNANNVSGDGTERRTILTDALHERMLLLSSLPRSLTLQALNLLVVISACLTSEDYLLIGPSLWARCFDWAEPQAVLSVRALPIKLRVMVLMGLF